MYKRVVNIFAFTMIFMFLISLKVSAVQAADTSTCDKSCTQVEECIPETDIKGIMITNSSTQVDASCVIENAKDEDSCFNGLPMSEYSGSYNSMGWRSCSSGSSCANGKRNHNGTDIGTGGKTDVLAYPVADDGVIALQNPRSNSSGRTLVINYQKKCNTGGSIKTGYHVVYRHLWKFLGKSGSRVKKDTAVGIVGGSNFTTGCGLCDHPSQARLDGNAVCSAGCYYDIHLHMEMFDGLFSGSSTAAAGKTRITPYCQNANVLCGGCPSAKDPTDPEQCANAGKRGSPQVLTQDTASNYSAEITDSGGGSHAFEQTKCNFQAYLDTNNCVFCELFKKIFNAASVIAKTANDGLAIPSRNLVSLAFLIWMCYYLFKFMASYSQVSSSEMLKGLLFQGFRVAVIVVILSGNIYPIMNITLNPVMKTGLDFASGIDKTTSCSADAPYMTNIMGYESDHGGYKSEKMTGGLPTDLGRSILCSVKKLEDGTGLMLKLGRYSICLGNKVYKILGIIPNLLYVTTGVFLFLAGAFLLIMFPWCLVDCMLQLCIAVALVPCCIAAFAFKSTSKYLKIIWNFFMNAMFNFVFLALIVYIINYNLKTWIGLTDGIPDHKIFIRALGNGIAWYGVGAFKVLAVCFFCMTFFDEAKDLAEKFADSPGLGGSEGIGRMVGGTQLQMAQKYVAEPAAKLAAGGAKLAGRGINAAVGDQLRSFGNRTKGFAISKLAGGTTTTSADGKNVSHSASFKFLGREYNVSATKGEDGKWNYEKESIRSDGSVRKVSQTAQSKTVQNFDQNGTKVSENTDFRSEKGNIDRLVRDDGTIRIKKFDEIMGDGANKEAAAAALVGKVMESRGQQLNSSFQKRDAVVNKDGSLTLTQVNTDGSTQTINAKMVGNIMVISNQTVDKNGNIKITTSNGLQSKQETFTKDKDGTYIHKEKYAFSEYVMKHNSSLQPLNTSGQWGFNIDRDKAMAGFTAEDFNNHVAQLNLQQMKKIMTQNQFNTDQLARQYAGMVEQAGLTQQDVQNILASRQRQINDIPSEENS